MIDGCHLHVLVNWSVFPVSYAHCFVVSGYIVVITWIMWVSHPYSMMTSSNGNISALLTICAGNSPVTGEFPTQRPVARSFDVFFDLHLNKRLGKQSRGCWFETLSHPLWRHCNSTWIPHWLRRQPWRIWVYQLSHNHSNTKKALTIRIIHDMYCAETRRLERHKEVSTQVSIWI